MHKKLPSEDHIHDKTNNDNNLEENVCGSAVVLSLVSSKRYSHSDDTECVLLPTERRGYWKTHNYNVRTNQVKIDGSIFDTKVEMLLDTGANISIISSNLARELKLEVIPFAEPQTFSGLDNISLLAEGCAWIKLIFGDTLKYKMKVWVGSYGATTPVILGTDFMIRSGMVLNLPDHCCELPDNYTIPIKPLIQPDAPMVHNTQNAQHKPSLRDDFHTDKLYDRIKIKKVRHRCVN